MATNNSANTTNNTNVTLQKLNQIITKYDYLIVENEILKNDFDKLLQHIKNSDLSGSKEKCKKIVSYLKKDIKQEAIAMQIMDDENLSLQDTSSPVDSDHFFKLKEDLDKFLKELGL